jgi:hypothetical protein
VKSKKQEKMQIQSFLLFTLHSLLFLMTFLKFLFWFLFGLAIVKYRERIQRWTGNLAFAEKYLGNTFNAYLLIGLMMMVMSIFYVTGILDGFLQGTFGRIFFTNP